MYPNPNLRGGTGPGWQQPPGPIPVGLDPIGMLANPMGSVPNVAGLQVPSFWLSQATIAIFRTQNLITPPPAAESDVIARALISSPVFDLRPELGGSAATMPDNAFPIYHGGMAACSFLMTGPALVTQPIRVSCYERADFQDPESMQITTQPQEITEDYFDGLQNAMLTFSPPPGPPRYWQVSILVDLLDSGNVNDLPFIRWRGYCGAM